MKKRTILIIMILPILLLITGCGNTKEPTKEETKTIKLEDKTFGYKTTFTYDKDENYSDLEVDENSGRSTEITFKNEDLNLEYQMYYTDMRTVSYDDSKKTRSEQKYYKEYTFRKYKAYAYGEYDNSLYLNILIDTDKESDMAKILFVALDKNDYTKEGIVSDELAKEKVQKLFNSMKVEKIK